MVSDPRAHGGAALQRGPRALCSNDWDYVVNRCSDTRAASTAAIWETREDAETRAYVAALDSMHKIVVGAETEAELQACAAELTAADVPHRRWVEQPEGIVTCLATRPGRRGDLQTFFRAFKLLR
jgi:peptidyl-tRNA hydrolase